MLCVVTYPGLAVLSLPGFLTSLSFPFLYDCNKVCEEAGDKGSPSKKACYLIKVKESRNMVVDGEPSYPPSHSNGWAYIPRPLYSFLEEAGPGSRKKTRITLRHTRSQITVHIRVFLTFNKKKE